MGSSTPFSPIVQIKDGVQKPPVFICHGLSGTVQFSELVKHIHTAQPIYGIQAKGIDGSEPPLSSVTEMADYYYDALQELYREESYVLVGYSFGGLVALEMAHRIVRHNRRVAQLILIDSYPHPRFMPAAWRIRLFIRRIGIHGQRVREMPSGSAFPYFVAGLKRRLHLVRPVNGTEGTPEMLALPLGEASLRRVKKSAYRAYASYRPTFYPGAIKFVTTADKTFFPGDPAAIWDTLVEKLEVDEVRGDHLNIVTSEFKPLACLLTRYLREVARQP